VNLRNSQIGQIIYKNPQTNVKFLYQLGSIRSTDLIDIIENYKYDNIQLDDIPYDVCVLPNNHLLCANYFERNLVEYNEKYEKINVIYELNGIPFGPISIALNNRNQIYICDYDNDRIIMTDLEFNEITCFNPTDDVTNELCNPKGLFYKNGHLYVCDNGNKRIQVLNRDLEYVKTIPLDDHPLSIHVSDKIIFVNCENKAFIYDLNCLALKSVCDGKLCRISELSSHFYAFNTDFTKIFVFDNNGVFLEEIETSRFKGFCSFEWWTDARFFYFNGYLLINLGKHFLKFTT
jgi:hypothetical protein